MKIALVLTNDWELFGDGSGDYYDVQHKPLQELLSILDTYNAKITLMTEVLQQFYHKEAGKSKPWAKEIADSWESILIETIKQNHDVQLHLHPQWVNSKPDEKKWLLDMSKWKLSSFNTDTINSLLRDGKEYLEQLIKPIRPDYSCVAFRAGGYGIQPENEIVGILKSNGFIADTTVSKNLFSPDMYNFRNAPSNVIPWFTDNGNLCTKGTKETGLLELPIYSLKKYHSLILKKLSPKLYFSHSFDAEISDEELTWMKERDKIKSVRYPVQNRYYKKSQKKGLKFYLNALLSENTFQLDYDYMPASVFLKVIEGILRDKNLAKYTEKGITIPVIASGHVKDMHSAENVELILKGIEKNFNGEVGSWTLTEAANYWIEKNNTEQ
jgi:hypothetical protein